MGSKKTIPVTVSWSGGKDSALALYYALQDAALQVASLHTSFDEELHRVGMHGTPEKLIEKQAEAIGLPLEKIYIPADATGEAYRNSMKAYYQKAACRGIEGVVFGDIFLEDLRNYRLELLKDTGLTAFFPLWQKDTSALITEFIALGFKTKLVAIDGTKLPKTLLGKVMDEDVLQELPNEADPCGENGEFHTFTYDGPLFKKPVAVNEGQMVEKPYTWKSVSPSGAVEENKAVFYFLELLPK